MKVMNEFSLAAEAMLLLICERFAVHPGDVDMSGLRIATEWSGGNDYEASFSLDNGTDGTVYWSHIGQEPHL